MRQVTRYHASRRQGLVAAVVVEYLEPHTPENSGCVGYEQRVAAKTAARSFLRQRHMRPREKPPGECTQASRDAATKARTHEFGGASSAFIASSSVSPRFSTMHVWQYPAEQGLPSRRIALHLNKIPWKSSPRAGDLVSPHLHAARCHATAERTDERGAREPHHEHCTVSPVGVVVHVCGSPRNSRQSVHATAPGTVCARGTAGASDRRPPSRRPEPGNTARRTWWLPTSFRTSARVAPFGISCSRPS